MANTVAYGFVGLEQVFDQQVIEVGVGTVWDAIEQSAQFHTDLVNRLSGNIITKTTDYKLKYYQPGSIEMQPVDEFGTPLPTRSTGYYDVAFPLREFAASFGGSRTAWPQMTVAQVNRELLSVFDADAKWLRRHFLASVFDNTTWTFADAKHGNLTIQPLANGDTVQYLRNTGTVSTDDHYLAQANAISDTDNPFDDIYDELVEHPGNDGDVVVYVPTNLKSSIEGLTDFHAAPLTNVDYGNDTTLAGNAGDDIIGFGDRYLGVANGCYIVEWKSLPDSYMVARVTGTNDVVAMRESEVATLQGLRPVQRTLDNGAVKFDFYRYAGLAVRNRVGALVYRIGNASYAVPTGYDQPLAV